jgi:hypothetical protein
MAAVATACRGSDDDDGAAGGASTAGRAPGDNDTNTATGAALRVGGSR